MQLGNLIPQRIKNIKHFFFSIFYNIYFGAPSRQLKVIGVTGTDGKTTTANMIYEILSNAGKKVGLITTINAKFREKTIETGFHATTPNPKLLQKILKQMSDEEMEYVILETTSHALDQYRVRGISYEAAVYTNVTHEHLDYHGTYENYLKTKASLMKLVKSGGLVVLNRDDSSFEKLERVAKSLSLKIIRYGFGKNSDVSARDYNSNSKINHFMVKSSGHEEFDVRLRLLGGYNVYNALAAISVALDLKIPTKFIVNALENFQSLEGRWEIIQKKSFKVIVDFAHTPNALEKALNLARKQVDPEHNVILVFGSAGKRDVLKRPMMGKIAGKFADKIILTAEDPRGEDVSQINRQIAEGFKKFNRKINKDYFNIPDRKEAIAKGISLAKPGDLVLITGKGHEKSMNLDGKNEIPWSDQEIVRKFLRRG